MSHPSQFDLLTKRRFLPLFLTQFLGAFNDNLFKNAFQVMIGYYGLKLAGWDKDVIIPALGGVFILPFFLFSTLAGQLAEKFDKATLARYVKTLEIVIMLLAALGFTTRSAEVLMLCLFLMGTHSTLFGPLKYSILPQYLVETELLGGNALVEMGTNVAILTGQIAGTILISQQGIGPTLISVACVGVAIFGLCTSLAMPPAPPTDATLKIDWNIFVETYRIISHVRKNQTVFHSLLGISWFWFFGIVYLSQLLSFSSDVLHGDESVYTWLITLFSLGVGLGSLLCERLSGRKVEIGLVPFGSIGLSLFGIDLFFSTPQIPHAHLTWLQMLHSHEHWHMMADIALLGVFGGFFIVPLYALVQLRTEPAYRSRAMAANNILNSFFMVLSVPISVIIMKLGASIPMLLLIVSLMNIAVAVYVYGLQPEFLMRFLVWIGTHTLYRVRHANLEQIPDDGPCILVCNHVSFMDALVLAGAIRRPVRFVMDHNIFKVPVLNFIFRTAGAIPIAPAKEDPGMKERAFLKVQEYLSQGEVVCIFPEGKITRDGEMNPFKPGVEEIAQRSGAPVVPLALRGLWGSFFSRKDGAAMLKMPRRFWSQIEVAAAAPVPAATVKADDLRATVLALRGDWK